MHDHGTAEHASTTTRTEADRPSPVEIAMLITRPERSAEGIVAPRQTAGLASYDNDSLDNLLESARSIPTDMLPASSFLTHPHPPARSNAVDRGMAHR